MFDRIFFWHHSNKVLDLDNLEKLLETSLQPIRPHNDYQANLRQRLKNYPKTGSGLVVQQAPETYQLRLNEPFFLVLGILSSAAMLVMGIRILVIILATLGLARNLKRRDRRTNLPSSPHPVI